MCANYIPPKPERIKAVFGLDCVDGEAGYPDETYPGYLAPIVRVADDVSGAMECVRACFGMVPSWAELTLARHTYNARSETVSSKPSFRHAWGKRQRCIVPVESFFEPSYESGRAVRWKITSTDHSMLGMAGLWEWRPNGGPQDRPLVSFTLLTINADEHALMSRFHRQEDEKRMPVLLKPSQYQYWLQAGEERIRECLQPYPAEKLIAEPAPRGAKSSAKAAPQPKAVSRKEPPSLWEEE
jgi:putative SOS response-associated peptidase YedK